MVQGPEIISIIYDKIACEILHTLLCSRRFENGLSFFVVRPYMRRPERYLCCSDVLFEFWELHTNLKQHVPKTFVNECTASAVWMLQCVQKKRQIGISSSIFLIVSNDFHTQHSNRYAHADTWKNKIPGHCSSQYSVRHGPFGGQVCHWRYERART